MHFYKSYTKDNNNNAKKLILTNEMNMMITLIFKNILTMRVSYIYLPNYALHFWLKSCFLLKLPIYFTLKEVEL